MHIQQIIIQGFKSYKSQTVIDPFSPKHNVIVGRNGSGKSNFFAAIRFVLGDDYTQMGREERQALLHEGSGSAVMTAYVEVIFDNTDQRFANGKDQMILRRTIGQKKDEYSLDHKNCTKTDIKNMLESAGFSSSNPYYIVPQGRVTKLTNMKDSERLNLLKEVAGTNQYQVKRQESKKLLEDAENRRATTKDRIDKFASEIGRLEEEKEELKGYQEKDREKRCLEYTIYRRDQEEVQAKLEELDDVRHSGTERTDQDRRDFIKGEAALSAIDDQIKELKQRIEFLNIDKKQYDDERKIAAREKAQIELEVKSALDGQATAQQARARHAEDIAELQRQIQQREAELAEILPRYNSQKEQETKARAALAQADGQRQSLYAKQSRQVQFKNKRDRDNWLTAQINDVNTSLATRKAVAMDTNETMAALTEGINTLDEEATRLRERLETRGDDSQAMSAAITAAKEELNRLSDQRRELYRRNDKLETKISDAQDDLQKTERSLSHMMDRNTSQGMTAVRRIIRQHNISGVYGTLAELFTPTNDGYKTAIEVTAGNSLFHYVVDTDETASKVLEILQREKAGRVSFMPLNRLNPKPTNMPKTNDVVPLIDRINYDPQFEKAFQQVFGKTLVCQNLQIAAQYARSHGVAAITADGDKADKKGALTGGYYDSGRSRLDVVKNVLKFRAQLDEHVAQQSQTRTEIEKLDQLVTKATSELQKAEQKQEMSTENSGLSMQIVHAKSREAQEKREELERAQHALENVNNLVQQLSRQCSEYEAELQSSFKKALTDAEEATLVTLATQVQESRKQVNQLSNSRSDLEATKSNLEVELRENLRMRLDQLQMEVVDLATGTGGSDDSQLQEQQRSLKRVEKTLAAAVKKLDEADRAIEQAQSELAQRQEQRSENEKAQMDLTVQMHRRQKMIEKSASRRAMYTNQAQDVQTKIRNLGVLPEAAFRKPYSDMKYDQALKRLHKLQDELKKYGKVNPKALLQYNEYTQKKELLTQDWEENDKGLKSILAMIDHLDQQKDEAIARTFRQVSKEFSQIFEKLVPAGKGSLKIQRRSDQRAQGEDEDSDDEERRAGSVENYTGVSIQVSFNSKHDEQQKIQQLSGGQKSLCALALVFAIQASDPAPFYLFDEIDANLDAQYRTAVAQMLQESSHNGQFICTTFRPEMLLVADKCYGVSYINKTSEIDVVDRKDALQFVEGQISGK